MGKSDNESILWSRPFGGTKGNADDTIMIEPHDYITTISLRNNTHWGCVSEITLHTLKGKKYTLKSIFQ